MKRILCAVASLNTGGAETFLMKLLRSIDKSKYMLDFVVSAPGVYDEEVKILGGKIFMVPLRTKQPIKTFMQIVKIVKKNKYAYFLKLCDTPVGILDLLAAKIGGAKRISVRSCNASSNSSKRAEMFYNVLRPFFNALSDCKIAPSDLAAQYTFGKKALRNGKVNKLNNGIDINAYKYDDISRDNIRNEFSVSKNTVIVGHIGRFNMQKNHAFIIDMFEKYHKVNSDSKLLLVGTGELVESIQNMIESKKLSDYVLFAGVRKDIPQLLSAMDVFVLPSFYEGMPNTVIEAQANGLMCLVSDTITREADVTGLVEFLPINSIDVWCDRIKSNSCFVHANTESLMRNNGYDIDTVCRKFQAYITGEKNEQEKND